MGRPISASAASMGLGFLMSNREPLYAGQRKTAEIVKGILNKAVSAGFAKSVTVGTLTDFETPLVKEQVDDWRFLTLMARRYGASLLVVDGEMIFDTAIDNDKEILALTLGVGLNRFSKRVSLAHQVGKVEIYGRGCEPEAHPGHGQLGHGGGQRQVRRSDGIRFQGCLSAGVQRICPHPERVPEAGPEPAEQPGHGLCIRGGGMCGHPRADPRPLP